SAASAASTLARGAIEITNRRCGAGVDASPARGSARLGTVEEGIGAPYGTRTHVSALRGRRPRPLDEGSAGCLGSARAAMIAMFRPRLNRHRHGSLLNPTDSQPRPRPKIIPRSEHPISRANISSNALKVLYRLKNAGYSAFIVGGGVRD